MRLTIKSFVVKILLIITVLSLTSCSQVKLAYGFLDNWVRWQINDYVDLNKDQNKMVRTASKEFHRWHRENELVRYSIFIEQVITKLDQQEINQNEIKTTFDQVTELFKTSVNQLREPTLDVAVTLSEEQIQDIIGVLEKEEQENLENREETTLEERREKAVKSTIKSFAKYIGKLSDEQKQIIDNTVARQISSHPYGTQRNKQWRTDFQQLMTTDLTQEENRQSLINVLFEYPDQIEEEHERIDEHNQEAAYDMLVQLHKTLTAKQKRKLFSKLRRYQNDFLDLAGVSSKEEILKAGI